MYKVFFFICLTFPILLCHSRAFFVIPAEAGIQKASSGKRLSLTSALKPLFMRTQFSVGWNLWFHPPEPTLNPRPPSLMEEIFIIPASSLEDAGIQKPRGYRVAIRPLS